MAILKIAVLSPRTPSRQAAIPTSRSTTCLRSCTTPPLRPAQIATEIAGLHDCTDESVRACSHGRTIADYSGNGHRMQPACKTQRDERCQTTTIQHQHRSEASRPQASYHLSHQRQQPRQLGREKWSMSSPAAKPPFNSGFPLTSCCRSDFRVLTPVVQ